MTQENIDETTEIQEYTALEEDYEGVDYTLSNHLDTLDLLITGELENRELSSRSALEDIELL